MKLSILICSLYKRQKFLSSMLSVLLPQIGKYTMSEIKIKNLLIRTYTSSDVEIIIAIDNKEMRVGAKRNELLDLASGEYLSFVDDDDILSDNYVEYLIIGAEQKRDVILFDVEISVNGSAYKVVKYDVNYERDADFPTHYVRIPNHIMCWRRSIVKEKFPKINMGEDAQWAKKMKRHIKTQSKINKTLYYYIFSNKTSETQ